MKWNLGTILEVAGLCGQLYTEDFVFISDFMTTNGTVIQILIVERLTTDILQNNL